MIRMACLVVLLAGSLAVAKERSFVEQVSDAVENRLSGLNEPFDEKPRFVFGGQNAAASPDSVFEAHGSMPDVARGWKGKTTVALGVDGTSAWYAGDVAHFAVCGEGRCYKEKPRSYSDWYHVTALVEAKGVKPIVWHIGEPISGADQKRAMAKGPMLNPLAKQIDAGAEDVAKLFESTLGDPKAFAATVSDRKDVVLYGSDLLERYVGGAAVRKQLAKWNLALKVQNGIQAGVTSSKTVAWVAAHVDAVSAKNRKAKPTPYRLLVIYEKTGTAWKLVHAHFSFTWN